jgi:5'-3' exonuclease
MTKALVDDIVLYKAACCGVVKEWWLMNGGTPVSSEPVTYAQSRTALKENPELTAVPIEVDRGFKACVFAFNQILNRVKRDTDCDEYVIVLSNRKQKTFRYDIATIKPYKGTRSEKPKYYDELYDEIVSKYPHMIATKKREVDDELGILQTQALMDGNETIICTSDKDLRQIPGAHYNLDSKEVYTVEREGSLSLRKGKVYGTGLKWFYAQMLLGDSADNIPGIPARKIPGEAKLVAQRILDGLTGDLEACERFVHECYVNQYGEKKGLTDHYAETRAQEAMTEVGRLLYMITNIDTKLWEPEYVC